MDEQTKGASFDIETLDVDGAIREMDEAVAGDSRADFLRKAAIGGGAMVGGGALMGALPDLAAANSPKQDIKILNFALTLEYLESEFYKEALRKNASQGDTVVDSVTRVVSNHENLHVRFLKKAHGSHAVKKPSFDFGDSTANKSNFLATAVALEDTGVRAYSGQGTRIFNKAYVKAALSILVVEARHASRFRALNNNKFAPSAFGAADSMTQVLRTVKKTGFIKS